MTIEEKMLKIILESTQDPFSSLENYDILYLQKEGRFNRIMTMNLGDQNSECTGIDILGQDIVFLNRYKLVSFENSLNVFNSNDISIINLASGKKEQIYFSREKVGRKTLADLIIMDPSIGRLISYENTGFIELNRHLFYNKQLFEREDKSCWDDNQQIFYSEFDDHEFSDNLVYDPIGKKLKNYSSVFPNIDFASIYRRMHRLEFINDKGLFISTKVPFNYRCKHTILSENGQIDIAPQDRQLYVYSPVSLEIAYVQGGRMILDGEDGLQSYELVDMDESRDIYPISYSPDGELILFGGENCLYVTDKEKTIRLDDKNIIFPRWFPSQ